MARDPLLYRGCAEHYLRGRPPYSEELGEILTLELGLDGHGTLVDVGCGPGVLAVQLASRFDAVIGIDPDAEMLSVAEGHAPAHAHPHVTWKRAYAEDIAALGLPAARVVSFGQSFHWTEREVVADAVYDLLIPGGALVAVTHDIEARPRARTAPPADPPIPHAEIEGLIADFLGSDFRTRRVTTWQASDRYADALARTRFGRARTVYAPGREGLTRDIDGVISGYLSMSYATPHLFGDRLDDFVAAARSRLALRTDTGRFSDWPGDTAIIIATKPE